MLNHADLNSHLDEFLGASHWYVGFSGGVDSTVLLHLMHHWRAVNPGSPGLSAIHINHGLQAAAEDWERHCDRVCRTWGLPLITRTVAVSAAGSGEAAAREVRYRAFVEQLQPGAVLFLGHHLDDQVETFFLRLLRGAGVEGLAAIPRTRTLGEGQLVRPLLDRGRSEIEHYARHYDLAYVEDPSNSNTSMDRNFLRAQVLPLLASRWPAYRKTVARASAHMAAAAVVLADNLEVPQGVSTVMGDPGLPLTPLVTGSREVAAAQLRAWLRGRGCTAPSHAVVDEFLRQLRAVGVDGSPRLVSSSCALQCFRDGVYLLPNFVDPPPTDSLELAPGESREVPGVGTLSLRQTDGAGLWLAHGEKFTLGWRRGGERCRLPGREGSRSLKTIMQERNVPPWWRGRVPLVSLAGELLAVGDFVCCASSRWRAAAGTGEKLWRLSWERPANAGSD